MDGLLHPSLMGPLADGCARIVVAAIGNHRPPIVFPGADHIELVAPLWPVLVCPEHPGPGIQRDPLDVAVTIGENLGPRIGSPAEGTVLGDASVRVDPHDLPEVVIKPLGMVTFAPLPQGHVEIPLAVEEEAAAEMVTLASLRLHAEDHLDVLEAVTPEVGAQHLGADPAISARHVREI